MGVTFVALSQLHPHAVFYPHPNPPPKMGREYLWTSRLIRPSPPVGEGLGRGGKICQARFTLSPALPHQGGGSYN